MYYIIFLISFYFFHIANGNECDNLGTIIYEDIGCKPVIQEGELCPIKYECDLEVRNNTCLFRGEEIANEDKISDDLINENCEIDCTCFSVFSSSEEFVKNEEDVPLGGTFSCAVLDCPEGFPGSELELGCYRTYHLDKCCSTGELCPPPGKALSTCTVDPERKVLEGQRFYPPNSCLKCVCPKNFNGNFEEPHCKRITCSAQIYYQKEITDHCAPFYREEGLLCCPSAWICPKSTDKIVKVDPTDKQNPDLKCKFGENNLELGDWVESTANFPWLGKEIKIKCECILPPFLTCI